MVAMSTTWSAHELLALGFPHPDTEYELPDLGALRATDPMDTSLKAFTGSIGAPRQRYFSAWMNLVRLTTKALRSYQAARVHLAEYRLHAYECRVVPYYRAVDNLEDTVAATHRGFVTAQRLTPVTGRKLPQPTRRQATLLRTIHDYIEHAEEKLIEQHAPAGELHVVLPRDKWLEVASVQLPYQDLAWCITKLHRGVGDWFKIMR